MHLYLIRTLFKLISIRSSNGFFFAFSRFKALVIKQKRLIIICLCIILFIGLLEDVLEGDLMTLDRLARAFFVDNLRTDWLTPIMESISSLATPLSLLVLLLVIVAFAPGKRPGMFCALNLVLVALLNAVLKEPRSASKTRTHQSSNRNRI